MKLILDREDLKPEYREINCSRTEFQHFTAKTQRAIRQVGRATFIEQNYSNYNAIFPPTAEVVRGNK